MKAGRLWIRHEVDAHTVIERPAIHCERDLYPLAYQRFLQGGR
jgi:hypothetical protein